MTSRSSHSNQYGAQSGLGSVFKSFTRSFKTPSNKQAPIIINPTVVGGGENQSKLFDELRPGNSVGVRVNAASKVADSLSKYSISSIPEIWYCARDLCDVANSENTRKVCLNLLILCIGHEDFKSVSSKLLFFRDICLFCEIKPTKLDSQFNLFIEALRKLTNDGRDIHDFCIYEKTTLGVFLSRCLSACKNEGKSDGKLLMDLIKFTANCLQYSFSLFEDGEVLSILNEIIEISSRTSNTLVLYSCVALIKNVVAYGSIPSQIFATIVEILCGAFTLGPQFSKVVWEAFSNLLHDTPQLTVSKVCNVLSRENEQAKNINACIGGISILQTSMERDFDSARTLESSLGKILESFNSLASLNLSQLNLKMLQFFHEALSNENVEFILPIQYWYSNTLSIYDVLNSIKLKNDNEIYMMESILDLLKTSMDNFKLPSPKDKMVDFFVKHDIYLSDPTVMFVLGYYSDEKLCLPFNPRWKENCLKLLGSFYYSNSRDTPIKIRVLEVIKESFDLSYPIFGIDVAQEIMFDVFKKSVVITDDELLSVLVEHFTDVCLKAPINFFLKLCEVLTSGFQKPKLVERRKSLVSINSTPSNKSAETKFSNFLLIKLTQAFSKLLILTSVRDGDKARELYYILIRVATFSIETNNIDLLLIASRCLIRLRATTEGFVYFVKPRDMDGLASTLGRNIDCGEDGESVQKDSAWKWCYPESLDYLPEDAFYSPSPKLKFLDVNESKLSFKDDQDLIEIAKWLEICLYIMENYMDWEIYSFIWAHFCPQLANLRLFEHHTEEILRLRVILTDQLQMKFPGNLQLPSNISKPDLQVAFIRTLSALFGYHDLFSKSDEDQIVSSLLVGLTSWEKTAIPCIHCLTVCCYEFPLSIKKYLALILTKLQTRISSSFATAHILEFLLSLVHLPTLTSNFTVDEFKRVFGIAFKYIQYSYDNAQDSTVEERPKTFSQVHGIDAEIENKPSTHTIGVTRVLSEYLLASSFNVLSSLFLKMKIDERKVLSSYLIKNLILSTKENKGDDNEHISDQGIVFLDLISRFTYSDLDLRSNSNFATQAKFSGHDKIIKNQWILGLSVYTIETDIETGDSVITVRRPTGTSFFKVKPDLGSLPMWFSDTSLSAREGFVVNSSAKKKFSPNYMLLQLINYMALSAKEKPLPIPDDSSSIRAISSFDRIPVVEFHKIGVIYIGPKQKDEVEILSNRIGSPQYQVFLKNLGNLIRLKDCKNFYVGGLDTESNSDGEYSLFWSDKITQLIFHVTTMMPPHENDKFSSLKKRHIGNNYVNIFFDESGLPFDFNVIKSQFNFLNIVISSHTETIAMYNSRESLPRNLSSSLLLNERKRFFKVKTYRRAGVPGIFATSHFKIISEEKLASFVRNLALVANQFASVWNSNDKYVSNWCHRLRQISTLKERVTGYHHNLKQEQIKLSSNAAGTSVSQSFLEQLQASDTADNTTTNAAPTSSIGAVTESQNQRYEYIDEDSDISELYKIFEINSYTS